MFRRCKSVDEAREIYEKVGRQLSPDKGGEAWMVDLLTSSFRDKVRSLEIAEVLPSMEEAGRMLEDILKYAQLREDFKADFFKSLYSTLKVKGALSDKQLIALVKAHDQYIK